MKTKTPGRGSAAPGPEPIENDRGLDAPTPDDLANETEAEIRQPEPRGDVLEGEDTPAARQYKDRWLRSEADLQNFRRRAQRDSEESRRFAEDRAMLATVEQLDDLERALVSAREAGASESWSEGVELVARRMREHLGRYGVTEIPAEGAKFDPAVHEAMLEVDAPEGVAPGHVVQVVRKGYQRDGRAIRPARVIVARRAGD